MIAKEGGMTTIHDDLIERSVDIRWPDGFDPDHADPFEHNAVVINAPANSVWAKLIAAAAWPTCYSNASDVVINDSSSPAPQAGVRRRPIAWDRLMFWDGPRYVAGSWSGWFFDLGWKLAV
jgi:hypothetical protein